MSLVKPVQHSQIGLYVPHVASPHMVALLGEEILERGFSENLTMELNVKGYPAEEVRRDEAEGTWMLSQFSYELQGTTPISLRIDADSEDLLSRGEPSEPDGHLWLFQGRVYFTADRQLKADDVRALLNVEVNKRRLLLEKAHALQAMSDNVDSSKRRAPIPQPVRVEVWQRDRGRCVECGGQEKLEFDHIIPIAMGGGNTARNLQLLCETCNRRKGASLG